MFGSFTAHHCLIFSARRRRYRTYDRRLRSIQTCCLRARRWDRRCSNWRSRRKRFHCSLPPRPSNQDGSIHFQLFRAYQLTKNSAEAQKALAQYQRLRSRYSVNH